MRREEGQLPANLHSIRTSTNEFVLSSSQSCILHWRGGDCNMFGTPPSAVGSLVLYREVIGDCTNLVGSVDLTHCGVCVGASSPTQ